jgi:hypothetical protein
MSLQLWSSEILGGAFTLSGVYVKFFFPPIKVESSVLKPCNVVHF